MDKVQRYKTLYPAEDGIENLAIVNGKVEIPKWLVHLLLHTSGLKSRKKRLIKKRLKREIIKILENYVEKN